MCVLIVLPKAAFLHCQVYVNELYAHFPDIYQVTFGCLNVALQAMKNVSLFWEGF